MNTTQTCDIQAFLGDGWTEQQIERITEKYLRIAPDVPEDEREAVLTAIAWCVAGVEVEVEVRPGIAPELSQKVQRAGDATTFRIRSAHSS